MGAKVVIKSLGLALTLALGNGVVAQDAQPKIRSASVSASTPHEVIKDITAQMMAVIEDGETALKTKPDEYYGKIRSVLEPTVSFGYIARNVMAGYWNKATEEQRKQFAEVFTQGMVETLGKGMANYSNLKIDTLPPEGEIKDQKRVEVLQEIRGTDGVNRVSYTMAKHPSGDWKLINVVLNGVNLGKSFRDQFAQAMRQHDNDIDKVIANWSGAQS